MHIKLKIKGIDALINEILRILVKVHDFVIRIYQNLIVGIYL